MYNSVQNAHVNWLFHNSLTVFFFFQKLIYYISHTLQVYPIFLTVLFLPSLNVYLCFPT